MFLGKTLFTPAIVRNRTAGIGGESTDYESTTPSSVFEENQRCNLIKCAFNSNFRDPVSNPSRKRAYWGWRPHRGYGRRKGWGGYTTADTSDEEK